MSNNLNEKNLSTSPSYEEVENFLHRHPEFFLNRDDLLASIELPHASGSAISLVEKQVSILRERSMDMRHRLNSLRETAQENEQLFHKTQNLVLDLLEVNSLDETITIAQSSLRDNFHVDTHAFLLFSDTNNIGPVNARVLAHSDASKYIKNLLRSKKVSCGILRESETNFLFPDAPKAIGSAAVTPLQTLQGETFGLLAIGSFDSEKYRSNTGTLFLSYVANVLNRIIPPYLN